MGLATVNFFSDAIGKYTTYNAIVPEDGQGPGRAQGSAVRAGHPSAQYSSPTGISTARRLDGPARGHAHASL